MPRKGASNARAYHLRRKFGITEGQYDQLLRQQKGCCAVCFRPAKQFKTRLAVDHSHSTGEIRWLLCINCNRYVIGRHVDPELLQQASNYLRGGTGWFVPKPVKKKRKRKK